MRDFKVTEKPPDSKRAYPAAYEKFIPIALGVLAAIVIGMLVFTILVGVGVLDFG
jgi:hypothetical protein